MNALEKAVKAAYEVTTDVLHLIPCNENKAQVKFGETILFEVLRSKLDSIVAGREGFPDYMEALYNFRELFDTKAIPAYYEAASKGVIKFTPAQQKDARATYKVVHCPYMRIKFNDFTPMGASFVRRSFRPGGPHRIIKNSLRR